MKTKLFFVLTLFCGFFNQTFAQNIYNNGERITSILDERWGASSAWENRYRQTVTYTTPTDLLVNWEEWDGFSWNTVIKYTATLNANYSLNSIVSQRWNSTQAAWRNSQRSTITYFNNDPTKQLVYASDTANAINNAAWDPVNRTTSTYNPNGLELQLLQERRNGSSWQGSSRKTSTYNANGLKIADIVQLWQTAGYWGANAKTVYFYNANSLLSLRLDSSATSTTSSGYQPNRKAQYFYNGASLLAQEQQTSYDRSTNMWEAHLNAKYTNTYNAQNLRTQQNHEWYDYNLGALVLQSTDTYTYNTANNLLVNTYINHQTATNSTRRTYTYSPFVNTENTTPSFEFSVFPNPSADQINISLPENGGVTAAMIMSANGQFVKAQNLTSTASAIDVQDLAAGSYQIILLQNGKSATKMFVKQ
jgi:hypothetical protein